MWKKIKKEVSESIELIPQIIITIVLYEFVKWLF